MEQKSKNRKHMQSLFLQGNHNLSLFSHEEVRAFEDKIFMKILKGKEKSFVHCILRDKDMQIKPEEIVRKLHTMRLIQHYG